tara:strand:- start:1211 stop:1354 length:144 start_codon:yes stop_codon:yes gene_type:complete
MGPFYKAQWCPQILQHHEKDGYDLALDKSVDPSTIEHSASLNNEPTE